MFSLALSPILIGLLVVAFIAISLMLMLVILIQRPQGGGLSEAFGSNSGSGHTAFGAKTGDALTTATIGMFVLFLLTAIGLNYVVRPPAPQIMPTVSQAPVLPGRESAGQASPEAPEGMTVIEGGMRVGPDGAVETTINDPFAEDEPTPDPDAPDQPSEDPPGDQ